VAAAFQPLFQPRRFFGKKSGFGDPAEIEAGLAGFLLYDLRVSMSAGGIQAAKIRI
jgi:hypothetical protein